MQLSCVKHGYEAYAKEKQFVGKGSTFIITVLIN